MIEISKSKEDNLILVNRSGEIHAQDLIDYVDRIDRDYKEFEKLYILDDARQSTFKFTHQDYQLLIAELEKRLSGFVRVYVAIVVDTPNATAMADIYRSMSKNLRNYFFEVFSTIEAARTWLRFSH